MGNVCGVPMTWDQLVALQQNRDLPELTPKRLWPDWHDQAACAGKPQEWFFPQRGDDVRPAKAVCASCPVNAECLAWALEQDTTTLQGIWGGTSMRERRQLRRDQRAA